MILSYPLNWAPLFVVLGALVVLNAYLALIAFAVIALLVVALVVGLIGVAVAELAGVVRRHARAAEHGSRPIQGDRSRGTAAR
jgi:cytochrome b